MNVSLNWLRQYIDLDYSPEKVGEMLTDIGLEVEGMEEVESIKGGLKGVVVGLVEACGKHPNADKLSLTRVNIGNGEPLQIVCGAPNVAKGQKVLVATVGTTLYMNNGEALKIKKGKIRGEVSQGMICAEDELSLGTDHSGIIVLPEDTQVGLPAAELYNIESDFVFEIGLTPNRSDATNHIGVARDLAAYLMTNEQQNGQIRLPDVSHFKPDHTDLPIAIEVPEPELCPRYAGLTIDNIKIDESPDWLKKRLNAIGVRPINNVVDITNFVLHELGQPLHAFDYDQIEGKKIIVKTLSEGTRFISLDEVERSLHSEDLMICNGKEEGMCIGGVFGGISSGVTDRTTKIFLESAHFNPKSIRRTSMRHNLRTDAAKVFEKGSDPNIVVYALKRAALLIRELSGGRIASEVYDLYPQPIERVKVTIRYARINTLIGEQISPATVKSILKALDMHIHEESDEALTIDIPTDKADVLREVDVIEEILRIYGFNKVPVPGAIRTAITVGSYPDATDVRNKLGEQLSANGFYEMMAVSLSESQYYKTYLPNLFAEEELIFINNTSNVQLDIMRPHMLFSGLEAILRNQNRQISRVKLFELGKTYRYDTQKKEIEENSHLTLFLSGEKAEESWHLPQVEQVDFYTLKAFVQLVLDKVGLSGFKMSTLKDEVFSYGLSYDRGPSNVVVLGKVNSRLLKSFGIREEVYYADFNWDILMKNTQRYKLFVEELNKFPSTRRDLALVIDNSVKFDDIAAIANKVGKKLIKNINLFDVYENEQQLGKGKKSYAVSFVFEDVNKTLVDKEVDKVVNKLITEYEKRLGATIRR